MRKQLTSLLTRCLPGVLVVTIILAVIGIFSVVIQALAMTSLIIFTGMSLTWVFLLATYLPEVLTMKHKDAALITAHWMAICNPGVHYDTCTGEPIITTTETRGISMIGKGPTSSY